MRYLGLVLTAILFISCSKIQVTGVKPKDRFFHRAWAKNFDPAYQTGNLPISTGSPLIHEDIVYMGTTDGKMFAMDIKDGRILWDAYEGKALGVRPGIFQDQLIYGSLEGRVYSRHRLSGKLNYSIDLGASVESRPVFYKGRAIFHLRNHKIICLDAITGKILWAYKRSVPNTTTIQSVSTPVVQDDKIYVGFADGHISVLSFEEGLLIWDKKVTTGSKFIDVDMTPVLHNGFLYIGSHAGKLHRLDPKTGKQIQTYDAVVTRSPLITKNYMYVGTADGKVFKMNHQGVMVAKKKLAKYSAVTNLTMWKGNLVVTTTSGYVYQLDPYTLSAKNEFHLGSAYSAVFGSIEKAKDYLAIYSSRNRLYIYK